MNTEESGQDASLAVRGEGICFRYGGRKSEWVLNGLNISVERGFIYGLLGPSGCGKTTLLRCIVGRHKPCSGIIRVYGKTPGQPGFCVPGPGVGFMPQELALYPEITTEETLMYFGRVYQMSKKVIKERILFLTEFLHIPDRKKQIKCLSGGQKRRVSLAAALIHKPPLLILDEPTVGVDPLLRRNIWNHLKKMATKDRMTIIITTHYVEEARQAHVVGLMRDGHLLAEENPEYLMLRYKEPTLEDVFLKLCMKESAALDDTEGKSFFEMEELDDSSQESQNEIWVPRKKNPENYRNAFHFKEQTTQENCKVSLLNGVNDVDIGFSMNERCCGGVRATAGRLTALNNKNFIRLMRNVLALVFQTIVPAIQVVVFCLCLGGQPFDLPLATVSFETDPSGKGKAFLSEIDSFTIQQNNYSNLSLALESVRRGESWGVLVIGETFTDSLINRFLLGIDADNETIQQSTIKLHLDMTNQQIAATIYATILQSFHRFAENMLVQNYKGPELATPPIVLEKPVYGEMRPNFIEFMAPGMTICITYVMAVGLTAMAIMIEKKEGLLDRSWIAGVQSWEVIFSLLFVLFIVMLVQVAIVLLLTFFVFNIPCKGSLLWVIIAVLLSGLQGMAYGLFVSAVSNDENAAIMIAMGSFFPNVMLSGIIWPIEAMPHYIRKISYWMPLTLITNTARCVLSRGWNILDNGIWGGYISAICWIFPVILLSSLIFKFRK